MSDLVTLGFIGVAEPTPEEIKAREEHEAKVQIEMRRLKQKAKDDRKYLSAAKLRARAEANLYPITITRKK